MVNNKLFGVFFRDKPARLLLALKNAKKEVYASTIAKEIDCTYSHVVKILQEMEEGKLVTFNKTGRLKLLNLTKRGEQVADNIARIRTIL